MNDERETRSRLFESAKREFLEKGYMKASLRNICRNAGVTTGALYFLFEDKEDLFASIVEEPLNKLYQVMTAHYEEEVEAVKNGKLQDQDFSEDLKTALQVVQYMYQYQDEFLLILTKSQGSRFENSIDLFIEITGKHYRLLADQISEQMQVGRADDYVIHWISHMQIDAFVYLLTHETSREEAGKYMQTILNYTIAGWFSMFK